MTADDPDSAPDTERDFSFQGTDEEADGAESDGTADPEGDEGADGHDREEEFSFADDNAGSSEPADGDAADEDAFSFADDEADGEGATDADASDTGGTGESPGDVSFVPEDPGDEEGDVSTAVYDSEEPADDTPEFGTAPHELRDRIDGARSGRNRYGVLAVFALAVEVGAVAGAAEAIDRGLVPEGRPTVLGLAALTVVLAVVAAFAAARFGRRRRDLAAARRELAAWQTTPRILTNLLSGSTDLAMDDGAELVTDHDRVVNRYSGIVGGYGTGRENGVLQAFRSDPGDGDYRLVVYTPDEWLSIAGAVDDIEAHVDADVLAAWDEDATSWLADIGWLESSIRKRVVPGLG